MTSGVEVEVEVELDGRARRGVAARSAVPATSPDGADETTRARSATAALFAGAVLMSLALPASDPGSIDCEFPVERAASALTGFTIEAGCSNARETQPEVRGPARLLFGLSLDVNRASRQALEALPSIGPARASAIVRARTVRRFESLSDLERVSGIGRKTSEGLRGWAVVTSATSATGEAATGGANARRESRWIVP